MFGQEDPEAITDARDTIEFLIKALNAKEKAVFRLKLQGLTGVEIAELQGKHKQRIYDTIRTGYRKMRKFGAIEIKGTATKRQSHIQHKERIVELKLQGYRSCEVAKELGIHFQIVSYYWGKYNAK